MQLRVTSVTLKGRHVSDKDDPAKLSLLVYAPQTRMQNAALLVPMPVPIDCTDVTELTVDLPPVPSSASLHFWLFEETNTGVGGAPAVSRRGHGYLADIRTIHTDKKYAVKLYNTGISASVGTLHVKFDSFELPDSYRTLRVTEGLLKQQHECACDYVHECSAVIDTYDLLPDFEGSYRIDNLFVTLPTGQLPFWVFLQENLLPTPASQEQCDFDCVSHLVAVAAHRLGFRTDADIPNALMPELLAETIAVLPLGLLYRIDRINHAHIDQWVNPLRFHSLLRVGEDCEDAACFASRIVFVLKRIRELRPAVSALAQRVADLTGRYTFYFALGHVCIGDTDQTRMQNMMNYQHCEDLRQGRRHTCKRSINMNLSCHAMVVGVPHEQRAALLSDKGFVKPADKQDLPFLPVELTNYATATAAWDAQPDQRKRIGARSSLLQEAQKLAPRQSETIWVKMSHNYSLEQYGPLELLVDLDRDAYRETAVYMLRTRRPRHTYLGASVIDLVRGTFDGATLDMVPLPIPSTRERNAMLACVQELPRVPPLPCVESKEELLLPEPVAADTDKVVVTAYNRSCDDDSWMDQAGTNCGLYLDSMRVLSVCKDVQLQERVFVRSE